MPYDVNLVLLPNGGSGLTLSTNLAGFPSTAFNYLLFSEWICLGSGGSRAVGVLNNISFFSVTANNSSQINVVLKTGLTTVFNGTYGGVPIASVRSHILISADPTTQTIQVYLNDEPVALTSGGWTGSGQFHISGAFSNWDIGAAGSLAPGAGLGDLYINNPASFYDLTDVSNRRKFINADLTPVDLGSDGSNPTGSPPPVFLTAQSGSAPDFANNNGTGGAFDVTSPPLTLETTLNCIELAISCGASTGSSITPTWSQSGGASPFSYTLEWRKQGDTAWNTITGINAFSYEITGLLGNTTYEWRIEADGATDFTTITTCTTGGVFTQVADLWFGNTDTFFDLSVESNRRKFIDASGCTVDLGQNGEKPFGTQPPVFLSVPAGGVAAQFANNYGSAGPFVINNPPITLLDPPSLPCCATGKPATKLLIWNGNRDNRGKEIWCSTDQNLTLTFIQHQEINSVLTAWGTDGTGIFPLFQVPTTAITKTVQSKLYPAAGGVSHNKSAVRFWAVWNYKQTLDPDFVLTVDSDQVQASVTLDVTPASGGGLVVLPPEAVGQWGALLGWSLETTCPDVTLISTSLGYEDVGYRG